MEEKSKEPQQEGVNVEKKAYTPPMLTNYGKLTELTAGGSGILTEPGGGGGPKDMNPRN